MVNAVRYEIEHVSRYRYAFQAQRCTMLLCLKPDNDRGQRLLDFEIQTVPPAFLNQETDCFGNRRHVLNLHSEHQTLEITARSTVEPAFLAPLPQPSWHRCLARNRVLERVLHPLGIRPSERVGQAVTASRRFR